MIYRYCIDLSCSREYIISEISITFEIRENNHVAATETTGATFQINNAKTYIPVVSLFINDNLKFLENVRQGFKRTIFMEQR